MASALAIANLRPAVTMPPVGKRLLALLLRVEGRLDRRAAARGLYRMDDHALADLGLSWADVERINEGLDLASSRR